METTSIETTGASGAPLIEYEIRGASRGHGTTSIEWTHETWNPYVGCSVLSAGCQNCYAMRMAERLALMGQAPYQGTTERRSGRPMWTGRINRNSDDVVYMPMRLNRPRMIFTSSMTDFWHPNAPDALRAEALDIMDVERHHRFQVLTKRPDLIPGALRRIGRDIPENVWLGATVEDERVAERIDQLRAVPARIRFLSVEPMTRRLGRVDLTGIHWVITGGESGPGRRPIRPEWVREVRDACQEQGVAFFHKQWGHWSDSPLVPHCPAGETPATWIKAVDPHGKGGALLDGVLWREFPEYLPGMGQPEAHQLALTA